MKKLLVAGIAAAALCSASALAADMPVKAAPAAIFNWSGMYVGGDGGYSWGKEKVSYFLTPCPDGCLTSKPRGGVIGPVLGIQTQMGNWVWGVEGSWNYSTESKRGPDAPAFVPAFDYRSHIKDFWTVGPRVGYASGNWLLFATGGFAQSLIKDEFFVTAAPVAVAATSARHNGWFVGGGVDMVVGKNTIFGIEYQHAGYGTHLDTSPASGVPVVDNSKYIKATDDIIRARLTFQMVSPFGSGSR